MAAEAGNVFARNKEAMVPHKSAQQITFKTGDGLNLRADAYGLSANEPVLLLHGGGQSRLSWKRTAFKLAEAGYYAIALDFRGHGESDWSKTGDYDQESFLKDVENIVDQLAKPVCLVGASLGGIVSLLVAGERRPQDIKAVVLVDIAPWAEDKGVARVLTFMNEHLNGFDNLEQAAAAIANYLKHRKKPALSSGLQNTLREGDDGRYYWRWDPALMKNLNVKQVIDEERLLQAAKRTPARMLLLRGVFSDVITAKSAERFLEHLPDAKYVEVEKAAHTIAGDSNEAFTKELVHFLDALKDTAV
jgi:non-heme chloroperoxidase